ncbi:hypothetical protein [Roseomonas haemaphysalidis]|uniref:XRE family transcriptional regulator n=1 Tax=Roseomonas haemaphysalidis TaxID=2768162 RepID=A0ABS3KWJ6_9PROT|nr:hypothetical protein [Roseomonas haemaphysalidis]MBO1081853.1 hypothetical protein [Roseomonas haemaphysalidis]
MSPKDQAPEQAAPDRIPLSQLPRELAAIASGQTVDYRAAYRQVLNGNLPADNIRSRWYIQRADLPAIAAAFGMTLRQHLSAGGRQASRTMRPVARGQQVAA